MHELRKVIEELSEVNQIVLSSHSPIFVNPSNIHNTIIVKDSRAKSAGHISEIREALGVRFSDNLYNANHVLLVEGPDDIIALKAIIGTKSEIIREALENGSIVFDHLGGASGLSNKASFYKTSACQVQCFLDNDHEGRRSVDKAMDLKTVKVSEVNLCTVPHLSDSELEDIYDRDVYREKFIREFNVDPKSRPMGKPKLKWSGIMERLFRKSGKPWNDAVKANVKNWLAVFAANSSGKIVREELQQPLLNFISAVEVKDQGINSFNRFRCRAEYQVPAIGYWSSLHQVECRAIGMLLDCDGDGAPARVGIIVTRRFFPFAKGDVGGTAPPSGLPAISPSRGEIGSGAARRCAVSLRRALLPTTPAELLPTTPAEHFITTPTRSLRDRPPLKGEVGRWSSQKYSCSGRTSRLPAFSAAMASATAAAPESVV